MRRTMRTRMIRIREAWKKLETMGRKNKKNEKNTNDGKNTKKNGREEKNK